MGCIWNTCCHTFGYFYILSSASLSPLGSKIHEGKVHICFLLSTQTSEWADVSFTSDTYWSFVFFKEVKAGFFSLTLEARCEHVTASLFPVPKERSWWRRLLPRHFKEPMPVSVSSLATADILDLWCPSRVATSSILCLNSLWAVQRLHSCTCQEADRQFS